MKITYDIESLDFKASRTADVVQYSCTRCDGLFEYTIFKELPTKKHKPYKSYFRNLAVLSNNNYLLLGTHKTTASAVAVCTDDYLKRIGATISQP